MTTIVVDLRNSLVAADRRVSWNNTHDGIQVNKLHRRKDGAVIAGTGEAAIIQRYVDWMLSGARAKTRPSLMNGDGRSYIYIIEPPGRVLCVTETGSYPVFGEFMAFGSGGEYAMGAMAMGASAERAIEIASTFDGATGPEVDVFYIPDKPTRRKSPKRRKLRR